MAARFYRWTVGANNERELFVATRDDGQEFVWLTDGSRWKPLTGTTIQDRLFDGDPAYAEVKFSDTDATSPVPRPGASAAA